jgi:arylsulfatase A-like enzyme
MQPGTTHFFLVSKTIFRQNRLTGNVKGFTHALVDASLSPVCHVISGTSYMGKSVLALVLVGLVSVSSVLGQTSRPNIVVILADDLGYGDVGFNGSPDIPTPNIDALAANGALCTNGYATHPVCSPSRAAIMTGRYQQRFGHENQPTFDTLVPENPRLGLPESELTLAQLLKPAGYVSGVIGKWHLGFAPNLFPTERGFDEFFGFLDAQQSYYNTWIWEYGTLVQESTYLTDAFTREAVSFINRHATEPFFLYLAYNAVHKPYDQPPDIYMNRVSYIRDFQRRVYAAMAVALDDGVGQVVATLQAQNLLNNTLIFFLSDNGAPDTSFTANSNLPLRGYKLDVLEGGIRVPFAVQWTERLPANVVYNDIVSSLDIVPTAAAAAGVVLPTDRGYDGLNIVPYLAGEQVSPARTLYWRWLSLGPDGPPGSKNTIWAVRSGPLKLVVEDAKSALPPALYNLTDDIGETQDLAAVEPGDVDSLTRLYAQWTLNTIPPTWHINTDQQLLPLVLAGDWNSFNKDDSNPPWKLTNITAPDLQGTPDAYNWYKTTIHVATTGGDTTPGSHSFTLIGTNSYSEQWGGVTINIDNTTDIPFFSGRALGPTNTITFENGFYYSLRILDADIYPVTDSYLTMAVTKTSGPPVSVSRTGQTPSVPAADDPVVVSIGLSQSKSVQERVYLRWTTDNFITSHLVTAQGIGTSYSATIPAQPAGSLLLYTIITSTADLAAYSGSGVIDSQTLATTGVFAAVPQTPPEITQQPANARVKVGRTARFQVVASSGTPLSYQWSKNGVAIAGATRSTYTTPPATRTDDGGRFSVVVSNGNGSATSKKALLKVK